MKIKNAAKEKIKNGQAIMGLRMDFGSPYIIERLAHIGFDFVLLDCEHSPMTEESCLDMVRACEHVGLTPLVRVPSNRPEVILHFLDLGAMGVIIPHCNTKEDAQHAVEAVKYPPEGIRGIAGRTQSLSEMPMAEYVVQANKETMVVVQIEEAEALDNLSEIITTDGIDVLYIGRADLSLSLGIAGQVSHPKITEAVKKIITEGRAAGKAVGVGALPINDPKIAREFLNQGAQFFVLDSTSILRNAAKELLQKIVSG